MHPDTLVYVNNLAVLLQNQNKLDEVGPISGHCIRGIWKMSSDYVHFALVESCRFMVRKLPAAKLICQQQHRPVISFLPIKGHGKRCVFITGWPPIPLSRGWYMSCFRDLFYITFTRPCWILLFFYHIYKYIIIRIRVYIYMYPSPRVGWCSAPGRLPSVVLRSIEAERFFRRALEGTEAQLGATHPSTLQSVTNLAALLKEQNKLDEAESISGSHTDRDR
jgi:hypothetical protein